MLVFSHFMRKNYIFLFRFGGYIAVVRISFCVLGCSSYFVSCPSEQVQNSPNDRGAAGEAAVPPQQGSTPPRTIRGF